MAAPRHGGQIPPGWPLLLALVLLTLAACRPTLPSFNGGDGAAGAALEVGQMVTAGALAPGNEPRDVRTRFTANERVIFAVIEVVRVEEGSRLTVRWTRPASGEVVLDSAPLVADQRYENVYLAFDLRAPEGRALDLLPGGYEVTLFADGVPVTSTRFEVE